MHRIAFAGALLLSAAAAHAQPDSGPYIGLAAGSFSYQESDDEFGPLVDDTTTSYRVIGGYQIHENLAIEGGVGRTGDIKESFPLFPSGSFDVRAEYELLTVRALWLVPMGNIDVFGGLGYFDATIKMGATATGFGTVFEAEDDDSGAALFGGVHYYLDKFTIRGEYEWFNTDSDVEAWNIGVGILFHF